MRLRAFALLIFAAVFAPIATPATAQPSSPVKLFLNTGPDPFNLYQILRYGGRDWQIMTALLRGTFDITTGPVLPGLADLIK